MNEPLAPEVVLRASEDPQALLQMTSEGVQRWVWESKYGAMLIEVIAGETFVNGRRVEPLMA